MPTSNAAAVPPPIPQDAVTTVFPETGPRTLDDLAALSADELLALYRRARVPSLPALKGDMIGRMLAVQGAGGRVRAALRRFAAWRRFPWRGKSFTPLSAARGEGINRVFSDRSPRRWFRFETFVGPSRAGDFEAVQLDYDLPENPFFIRAVKDEIRLVAAEPGSRLYLGQAYLVTRRRTRLVLYFALQSASA